MIYGYLPENARKRNSGSEQPHAVKAYSRVYISIAHFIAYNTTPHVFCIFSVFFVSPKSEKMRVEDTFWISVSEQIKLIVSRDTELRDQKRYITITEHDRTWCCPACGETHNRDVNASIDLYLVTQTVQNCTCLVQSSPDQVGRD